VKCIKCGVDNNLKDRKANTGRCKGCRHEFAFDPKIMPNVDFTDKFFQQMLATISVNDSLFFTRRQLHYFFNHRRNATKKHPLQKLGCGGLIALFILTIFLTNTVGFSALWFIPVLFAGVLFVALMSSKQARKYFGGVRIQELDVPQGKVESWYRRWLQINGPAGKLLEPPAKPKPEAANISPELMKYSFDRAVVCDQAEIAQCLIANNFHFEHNCAVLSVDGYPHDIFSTVMEMLARNPSLSVYALHDASIGGVELTHTLRTSPQWFAESSASIYDVGLLPRQVFNRPLFVEQKSAATVPAHVAATLQPDEVRWLEAGNYVSLQSFTPAMLMRVLAHGIARSRDPQATDALVPVTADGGGDTGVWFYTFDSFG
jgi:hypothetical protein